MSSYIFDCKTYLARALDGVSGALQFAVTLMEFAVFIAALVYLGTFHAYQMVSF